MFLYNRKKVTLNWDFRWRNVFAIYKTVWRTEVENFIEELNLPKTIKDYLAYKDRARQNTGQHNSHANSLINTNPSATPSSNSTHNFSSNNVAGNVTSQGNNAQSVNLNATGNIQAGSNDNSAAGSALEIEENDVNIDSDEDETMTEEPNVPNSSAPQTSVVSSWVR